MPAPRTGQADLPHPALGQDFTPLLAEVAKLSVELAKEQIEVQRLRIVRQRELIAKFDRQNYGALLLEATQSLKKMEEAMARMEARLATAQQALSQASADESSVEKVERDTPM